jgi:hypothetical protein
MVIVTEEVAIREIETEILPFRTVHQGRRPALILISLQ